MAQACAAVARAAVIFLNGGLGEFDEQVSHSLVN